MSVKDLQVEFNDQEAQRNVARAFRRLVRAGEQLVHAQGKLILAYDVVGSVPTVTGKRRHASLFPGQHVQHCRDVAAIVAASY